MKSSGKWFLRFEAVMATLVLMIAVMMREKSNRDPGRISVLIQNSEDNQWAAFRYGLKMAAQDREVELVIVSTGELLTQEEAIFTATQEITQGADAVMMQPVFGIREKDLKKLQKKVPVMLVESDLSSGQNADGLPSVQPDHNAMGRALAQEIQKDFGGSLSGKTIGIISETDQTEASARRKKGFEEALQDTGAKIRWAVSSIEETGENFLKYQPAVNLIAAMDDHSLIAAGKDSQFNNLHGALVYGIGNSTDAIYELDIGAVECLIVPDTFDMGYQSLTQIAQSLKHPVQKMESSVVSYTALRRDELFSEKNQEILFTMSQ